MGKFPYRVYERRSMLEIWILFRLFFFFFFSCVCVFVCTYISCFVNAGKSTYLSKGVWADCQKILGWASLHKACQKWLQKASAHHHDSALLSTLEEVFSLLSTRQVASSSSPKWKCCPFSAGDNLNWQLLKLQSSCLVKCLSALCLDVVKIITVLKCGRSL